MKKDIEAAYNAEIQYYKDKETQHSNVLDILDYIKPCGYETYDEYYKDAQFFKMKSLEYVIDEVPNIREDCYVKYLQQQIPAVVYNIHSDNNFAFVPNSFDKDELLAQYNIIPQRMNYEADYGVIITADGDLKMVIIMPEDIDIDKNYFLYKLNDYLNEFFDNVRIDNNDILIDNKKVIGTGVTDINHMNVYMFQITFIDRSELIKQICTTSIKEPGNINANVLSQEKLLNEIISWLKQ